MDVKGLHFKITDVIGSVPLIGTAKLKLAILAFLYCKEFVKNPIELLQVLPCM